MSFSEINQWGDGMPSIKSEESIIGQLPLRDFERPYNTINFLPNISTTPVSNIENLSAEEQESILIRELLFILNGVESNIITIQPIPSNKIRFIVDNRIEHSLRDLSLQIAQVGEYYYNVARYMENWCKFEYGKVNHALTSVIRGLIKDYIVMLGKMENHYKTSDITLQKLWFFVNPTLQMFILISGIVVEIDEKNLKGGEVLSLLHSKSLSLVGDTVLQNLCINLSDKASRPYLDILQDWIYKGLIDDPFNEFFVIENDLGEETDESNDQYWQKKYTLDKSKCPSFLKKVENEILKAGQYLNVIRGCGHDLSQIIYEGAKISYSIHERVYIEAVEKAYTFSSKKLLNLLLNEYDLLRRLESLKHYLLMDQGDFIVQFLDLTEDELCKKIDELNPVRLESLLELALRTSSSSTDPFKDCVKVQLVPYGISNQMQAIIRINESNNISQVDQCNFGLSGFEGFSFSYLAKWPVSLILNESALTCYQMIFRQLFYCKHVERELCKVWISEKTLKKINLKTNTDKAASFSLRQKMLNFVQNLQYYMAFEAIEPAWHIFLATMNKVANVDQVMECHLKLINSILDDLMLTNETLLNKIHKLLQICLEFCKKLLSSSDLSTVAASSVEIKYDELDKKFSNTLSEFLLDISNISQIPNQSTRVINIIHRVNFNGFYTEELEECCHNLKNSISNIVL